MCWAFRDEGLLCVVHLGLGDYYVMNNVYTPCKSFVIVPSFQISKRSSKQQLVNQALQPAPI